MKKNSIISIIIILLILLTAILFVRGCSQEGSEMKKYTVEGTYTETATYQNGEIQVADVNIENATFTGNLTIIDTVVDGDIRLSNSAVQGELLVKGGGTVYLDGGSYQHIILEKQGVKIVLLGDATVENLTARAAANIEVDDQSKIKTLNIDKAASRTTIATQENGTIENIQSRGISDIVLNTPAKLIGFGTNASGSTLVSNAVIEKIVAESKVLLTLNANVGTVLLTATGEGTSITLGNNAVISSLATETRIEITGEGSITSATTNDVLNITGSITPDVVYITTKPVVSDPNGGLMVSTNTSRPAETTSGGSSSWYSDSSSSGTIINSKYDVPPLNPVDPVDPPSPPTPPSPPINIAVEAIQVTPVEADVIMGNTLKLNTVIFPANASNKTIIWESSNNNVATVSNGVVTPVTNGETTITARTQDGNKTDTCKITVKTNIAAVTMINTINAVNNGIAETIAYDSSYTLPVVVIVQGHGSEIFPCSVTWTPNTVDTKKVGETTYTGTLVMPANYVNLNNVQATIALTVLAQPVITASSELSSQRIYLNEDPAPVFVEATVTEDKTLSYQWFSRTGEVETPMPEITGPIYDPPVSTSPGTVYYNCIITSENAEPVTVLAGIIVTSPEPAVLPESPAEPVDAADQSDPTNPVASATVSEMPTINEQPNSISQLSSVALATSLAQATRTAQAALGTPKSEATTATFSVDASISDGGELSYQWFESSDAVNADGQPIDGATDKTFEVDASGPAGTTYYYVEITNSKTGCLPVTAVSLPVSLTVV